MDEDELLNPISNDDDMLIPVVFQDGIQRNVLFSHFEAIMSGLIPEISCLMAVIRMRVSANSRSTSFDSISEHLFLTDSSSVISIALEIFEILVSPATAVNTDRINNAYFIFSLHSPFRLHIHGEKSMDDANDVFEAG